MPKKSESLEAVFYRVIRDSRQLGKPVTPRSLALAAGLAGWKHPTAKLVEKGGYDEQSDE